MILTLLISSLEIIRYLFENFQVLIFLLIIFLILRNFFKPKPLPSLSNEATSEITEEEYLIKRKYNLADKNTVPVLNKTTGIIYKITNIKTGYSYIGKTVNSFNERYPGTFKTHNKYLQHDIDLFGLEKFSVEILEFNLSNDVIEKVEKYYIKTSRKLYNIINN